MCIRDRYKGSVKVAGTEIREHTNQFYENIGVDFEFSTCYEKFTARQNLAYFASLYEKQPRSIDELLHMVGLENDGDKKVADFSKGMRSRLNLDVYKRQRQNTADKRMELQKAQEARQAKRKADGSATTGATRPHERPATASIIPKSSAEKMQEVKRPATATTSKASEPVKTNVVKERLLSSGASDRKATQSAQPAHRQNIEKVTVSKGTRQNDTKDRRTKVQQTQTVQKNQQTTEKSRKLVTKKGQKKK